MLQKLMDDKRFESTEELKLYLMVLKMQNKHQQVLDILQGEWGDCLKVAIEREKMKLEMMQTLGLWQDVQSRCRFLLNEEYVW